MVDLRTQAVRPATVSYTPLDLRGIKANLMGKVQEVESNANAGKDLMSKLDFKDGYAASGLGKELQQEYTTKLQALVDGLYSTGDTRSFSSNLSRIANEMNVDPRAKAGLKDFQLSKTYDQMAIDPNYATFEFLFTDDKTPGGNIAPIDWRNNPDLLTEENIVNFFGRVIPPENIYQDYTSIFADQLATITVQSLFGEDPETGMVTFKTDQQVRDLPPEQINFYNEVKNLGLSPAEALAYSLRQGTPEQRALYAQLATDYQGGTTNTAVNLRRSKELSQDEFIGEVVFQSFPYLGKTSYEQRVDTRGGGRGGDTPTVPETTSVTTNAISSIIYPGPQDAVKRQEFADLLDIGDESIPAIAELVFSRNEEDKETAAIFTSILGDFDRNGDPQYQKVFQNGAELRTAANSAAEQILVLPQVEGAKSFKAFVTENNLLKPEENSLTYFQRLKNTIGYLGKSSDTDLREDAAEVIATYDGLAENADFVNQITFGIGVLTPQELRSYLAATPTMIKVKNEIGIPFPKSSIDYSIDAYSEASNTIKLGDTEYGFLEFFTEKGTLTDSQLLEIKESNPIAFYELAKRDYMQRANLYYTDVLLEPGQLQMGALRDATTNMQTSWATKFPGDVGPNFFANWEVREYVTASEGGTTVSRSSGVESPRVTTDLELTSPYVLLEQDDASDLVQKFIAAKDTSGMSDAAKANIGNWTFGGILIPQGLQSQTALMFTHTTTEGGKAKNKTYMFTPKSPTDLSANAVFRQMNLTQQTLAGKKYLPIVEAGEGFVGQNAQKIGQSLLEKVDVQDVSTDYFWTDTKEQLNGTQYFTVNGQINDEVDNPYNSGNLSVTAAVNNGAEVYKIRKKDGTGSFTWGEYFENFSAQPDVANTYMGVADYENFLISIYHNREMLNQRGANITDTKIEDLLISTDMGTLADIGESLEIDFMQLLDTPITFIDRQEALHHFSGQSSRPTDSRGNPRAGYFPK